MGNLLVLLPKLVESLTGLLKAGLYDIKAVGLLIKLTDLLLRVGILDRTTHELIKLMLFVQNLELKVGLIGRRCRSLPLNRAFCATLAYASVRRMLD